MTRPRHTQGANPALDALKLAYLRLSLAATGLFNLSTGVRQRLDADRSSFMQLRCVQTVSFPRTSLAVQTVAITVSEQQAHVPAFVPSTATVEMNEGQCKTLLWKQEETEEIQKKT